jgi:Mg2+/citrate symporter
MVAMRIAPSYLMMLLSFWLTARTRKRVKMALSMLDMNPGQLAPAASKQSENLNPNQMFWSGAIAKVPPPVGCVKYKAQPVVLFVQIPLFTAHSQKQRPEIRDLAVEVAKEARWLRILRGGE